jgi:hypothetical protein
MRAMVQPPRAHKLTFARFVLFSGAVAATFLACGSRTGLLVEEEQPPGVDAAQDHTVADGFRADVHDARHEGETPVDSRVEHDAPIDAFDAPILFEGGPLDAQPECTTPTYCDPKDPGKIFKCGVPVFQCSSLEQCEEISDGASAKCVNPCVDTLGQNTSNGCTYYIQEMDTDSMVAGVCYAVFLVNQWKTGERARIQVTLGGNVLPIDQFARIPVGKGTGISYTPYDPVAGLAKDEIAILFLSRDPNAVNDPNPEAPRALANCPPGVTPAVVGDAALHGTGVADAFGIRTNVPVVAYDMLPYGAGRARVTSATLLLPTNVWDTNYLMTSAFEAPQMFAGALPTMMIFGQQDGTQVTILPTQPIEAGGSLQGSPANVPVTYTVNAGQYLQFTQVADLTGSVIQSDKPVALVGGTQEIDVPTDRLRADSAHQMIPPVHALGNQYLAVRYRARTAHPDEAVPWRIVGGIDGTQLTYDPPQAGAPATINAHQVLEFTVPGPFVVSSQDAAHPFYLAQYMTGGEIADAGGGGDTPLNGEGDPEYVNVVPPAQYLPRYTFFTDPTYPETNLVVTRVLDPTTGAFPRVTLDCAGVLGGWQPVGGSGQFEFTRIDLSTGNFQGQNGCDNGVHVIDATLPGIGDAGPGPTPSFGVTVWGWGSEATYPGGIETNPLFTRWVSYGYPAGANLKPLNSVIVPAR